MAGASYDTKLSAEDEKSFKGWLGTTGREADLEDYDLRKTPAQTIYPNQGSAAPAGMTGVRG